MQNSRLARGRPSCPDAPVAHPVLPYAPSGERWRIPRKQRFRRQPHAAPAAFRCSHPRNGTGASLHPRKLHHLRDQAAGQGEEVPQYPGAVRQRHRHRRWGQGQEFGFKSSRK